MSAAEKIPLLNEAKQREAACVTDLRELVAELTHTL